LKVNNFKCFIRKKNFFFDYFKEWRRKWQAGSQWLDADVEELYEDLHDIHPHVCFSIY
jgi:hypothetical protein